MSPRNQKDGSVVVNVVKAKAKGKVVAWLLGGTAGIVLLVAILIIVIAMAVAVVFIPSGSAVAGNGSCVQPGPSGPVAGVNIDTTGITIEGQAMTEEQTADAETIIGIGRSRTDISDRDILIALMTSIQETRLKNPPDGDGTSVGIFQQTTSYGTIDQRHDPAYATTQFYDHLASIADREQMSLIDVAIAVQAPNRADYEATFNNWQPAAEALLDAAGLAQSQAAPGTQVPQQVVDTSSCNGADPSSNGVGSTGSTDPAACKSAVSASNPQVETAIQFACSVLGTPYVWGGQSEEGGFDCSGLVWWAFSQAGFPVGDRTNAAGEYAWPSTIGFGVNEPFQAAQRGDLIFWYDKDDGIHHVAIYLGGGLIVYAPETGEVVKVGPIYNQDQIIGIVHFP